MSINLQVLVGQRIKQVFVRGGDRAEDAIAFVTERGTFAFDTGADCCSETWFADIINRAALSGGGWSARVSRVTEMQFPKNAGEDGRSRQDSDEVMGFEIRTHRGVCQIIYRNSSNGYYGGSLNGCFVPESLEGWTEITEDWQA
jgi:hypothetical protein